MKKKILIGLVSTLFCFNSSTLFAASDRLCIALTNDSSVDFDSLVSPGQGYTVQPKQTATLSRDHMVGACITRNGLCIVSVFPLDNSGDGALIRDLPRGTHIIYGGPNDYYLDKNAQMPCIG